MTYKTDLQTNNTNLQSILDTVNALPEAGSGGGTSSGAKFATGNITITEGLKSSGVEIATVSGLGFRPSAVFISLSSGTNANITSTSYYVILSSYNIDGVVSQSTMFQRKSSYTRTYCSSGYATITLNSDGFTWSSDNSNSYTGFSYRYIAVE